MLLASFCALGDSSFDSEVENEDGCSPLVAAVQAATIAMTTLIRVLIRICGALRHSEKVIVPAILQHLGRRATHHVRSNPGICVYHDVVEKSRALTRRHDVYQQTRQRSLSSYL